MRAPKIARRLVKAFNDRVAALANSPRWSGLVGRKIVIITYTGRRSGNTFSTPVAYRRKGDDVTIGVQLPDAKNWWRNFLGSGGPLGLRLEGTDRTGHAVAHRGDDGRVDVKVSLNPI